MKTTGGYRLWVTYPAVLMTLSFDASIDKAVGKERAMCRSDNLTREIEFDFISPENALAAKARCQWLHADIKATVVTATFR